MLALRILEEIREKIVKNDGSVDELCEIGQAIIEVREIKEKAKKYDEHIENQEIIKKEYKRLEKEAEPLREKAKEARHKSLKLINHLDKMISEAKEISNDLKGGYLGAKVEPRKSFADKIKQKKKDVRRIAKKGIYYRDKIYTFDGYEKYMGKVVTFEVQEPYLIVTLEDKVFHAVTQDI